jgi:hypothetical protein
MGYNATLEEGKWPDAFGPVNNLIRYDEIPGLNGLLQTANGRKGNHRSHAKTAQGRDICPVGDFMGSDLMVCAVSAEERDGDVFAGNAAFMVQNTDGRGRLAPGCLDIESGGFGEAGEVLETSASDDCNADLVWFAISSQLVSRQWAFKG